MMKDKLFRSDLYYRLKVFPITTTPLRDHSEDIPILARYFTRKYAATMNRRM
jgi:formate hydrogenlyase transcriptional activator